jgi:hypothetical protein
MKLKTPLATALLLCALVMPSQAGEQLASNELRKLAPGRYAVNVMGLVNMTVSLRPNGVITGTTSKGKRDTGFWTVSGSRFCVVWSRWLGAKRRCASLTGSNGTYSGGGLWMTRI